MALQSAIRRMLSLTIFSFLMFFVYGIFGLKLLKGKLNYCTAVSEELLETVIQDKMDCFDYGGSWRPVRAG
jgi:hypothetical protein